MMSDNIILDFIEIIMKHEFVEWLCIGLLIVCCVFKPCKTQIKLPFCQNYFWHGWEGSETL